MNMKPQSEAVNELGKALVKAQRELPNATLNKTNPHFKNRYADLGAVRDAILGVFNKHGLAITQGGEVWDGFPVLVTTLIHESGQWKSFGLPLPGGLSPQQMGSAVTYNRRYGASALAFIFAEEDDDANAAENKAPKPRFDTVNPPISEMAQRAANDNFKPPIDPVTGACTPHAINISKEQRATRPNLSYIAHWGALFITALDHAKTTAEVDQWAMYNEAALLNAESSPKVHAKVTAAIAATRAKLPPSGPPDAAAFLADLTAEFEKCKTGKAVDAVWLGNEAALRSLPADPYDRAMAVYQRHIDRVAVKAA